MKDDYLSELNEPQRKAVECTEGPVMIIAGAGSGKTRVLTYRIAYLLTHGVDAFQIMALTFTNKAAREMKSRIETLAGSEARNLWMGTYHSVFARLLRMDAPRLSYPSNFTIYDTEDSKSIIKSILKEQNLSDKTYKPSTVLARISSAKNNLLSWQAYNQDSELVNSDIQAGRPMMGKLYELYSKRCFRSAAMDFDDLLYNTYLLLDRFPDLLHKFQSKFRYLMVDEFQDTNYLQYIIIRRLAALHENICVVGDDAQSIYAFRGANIQNILSFGKDYPDHKVFKLEQNYRSTATIVNAANSIISQNKKQLPKKIWTANDEGNKIKLLRALSDNEEGSIIADIIYSEQMTHDYTYRDFAVLYRTNAQSRALEEALRRRNIAYRIYGGLSFYARKEIKDMLAYFRLAVNPHDEESLKRIINYPVRGIGQTSIDRLIATAGESEVSLWEVICNLDHYKSGISGGIKTKISAFADMIRSFNVMLVKQPAYELAMHIANHSGLLRELYHDKTPEGISRYENLQELLSAIREFTETGNTPLPGPDNETPADDSRTLDAFLQDIALLTDNDNKKEEEDKNRVSLMTVHMAKGLEFKQVFVAGLEENLFPSQLSLVDRDDLEEERRLFYVAITRAEKKLYLSYASTRYRWGNLIGCEPSRFLNEIRPEYLDQPVSAQFDSFQETSHNVWNEKAVVRKNNFTGAAQGRFKPVGKTVNPAPVNDFESDDPRKIVTGMEVLHARFGKGKVLSIEGGYPDIKATVFFQGHGTKMLLLKFARLKIV
ncbi:MAG: ATP-dependent helicase [Bacteroidia bacterium]|nr:UvrD-helicase domain-containing protein [Bacteroidia bacterium]MCZ2278078.1 ATP-dependent helicase [Bacteroidia bacterium]